MIGSLIAWAIAAAGMLMLAFVFQMLPYSEIATPGSPRWVASSRRRSANGAAYSSASA